MKIRNRLLRLLVLTILACLISPALQAATAADYYQAALQLYNAKNYSLAVQYFGAAISLDPNNMAAYQGRANCEYSLGNKEAALADYQKVYAAQPTPQLLQFIQALQAQVGAPPPIPAQALKPAAPKDLTYSDTYDVRLTFGASTLTLGDFKNNANSIETMGKYFQSLGYNPSMTGSVPDGFAPMVEIEWSKRFGPELELGASFTFVPVGTATDNFQLAGYSGLRPVTVSQQDSSNITAYLIGFHLRYTLGHGDFRPFIAGGPLLGAVQIAYSVNDSYLDESGNPLPPYTINGTFASLGIGGQVQVGLDWDLGNGFVVSPLVGGQFVSADNFQATMSNTSSSSSASGSGSGSGQTVTLNVVNTDFGPMIEPISNGEVVRGIYSKQGFSYGQTAPSSTPLTVDLSGIKANLQVSYNF